MKINPDRCFWCDKSTNNVRVIGDLCIYVCESKFCRKQLENMRKQAIIKEMKRWRTRGLKDRFK